MASPVIHITKVYVTVNTHPKGSVYTVIHTLMLILDLQFA